MDYSKLIQDRLKGGRLIPDEIMVALIEAQSRTDAAEETAAALEKIATQLSRIATNIARK